MCDPIFGTDKDAETYGRMHQISPVHVFFSRLFDVTVVMSHTIHVWCIYMHLVDFYGKCRVNIPYMDPMGFM